MGVPARAPQIIYDWTGEVMRPLPFHLDLCLRTFESGKRYKLTQARQRSRESHGHYFAVVTRYWENWPHGYERKFPNADQLRKHALIRTGWYVQIVMAHSCSESAVHYVTTFKRQIDYAEGSIVTTERGTATVMRVAVTQQLLGDDGVGMDDEEFQKSKQSVLDFCASVTGISPEQMGREVKKGAAA